MTTISIVDRAADTRMVHRMPHPKLRMGIVAVGYLFCIGCGSNLAQVSGRVTLDGEPLRGGDGVHATVFFQPASGKGATAVGVVDENGNYQLSTGSQSGIAPGEYLVSCSASQIISSPDGGTPVGKRMTDSKYASAKTSGFRFAVQSGANQFDIPLESPQRGTARK